MLLDERFLASMKRPRVWQFSFPALLMLLTVALSVPASYPASCAIAGDREDAGKDAPPAAEATEYSAEKVGVRKIAHGGKACQIPWYRVRADYNSIETAEFWKKLRSVPGSKTAYTGRYHEMTWCEWFPDGTRGQLVGWGVDFLQPADSFRVAPGPGEVGIRRWLFEEQQRGQDMAFKGDLHQVRYYVFCLDREPVEQWRSLGDDPMCDLDAELEHVIGIIEIEPTFELGEPSSPAVLHVTQESLVTFRHERHGVSRGYEQEYAVVRAQDGALRFEAQGLPSAPASPEVVQKLLYAINTCEWRKQSGLHAFAISPPVTRTIVAYRDKKGQSRKVTICYDMGGWFMERFDFTHYASAHPHLLFEVAAGIQAACAGNR